MNQITLTAQVRSEQGSKAAGRLRRAGMIPGIIKRMNGDATLIQLDAHDYDMAMRGHHGDQLLVVIDLGQTKVSALLRELQHDVISGTSSAPPTASRTPTASSSRTSAPSTSTASPPTSSRASTSTSPP